ncbi:MAG: hypothetical protein AAF004_05220, partial [Pseudomonadota bacterium]
ENSANQETEETNIAKSAMLRDAIVFQIKLLIDGVRDLVLIPVSLIGTVVSLLHPGKHAGRAFYSIVEAGRESEKLINLFEAANRVLPDEEKSERSDLDGLVDQVEGYVKREYKSERFAAARERLEAALKSIDPNRAEPVEPKQEKSHHE